MGGWADGRAGEGVRARVAAQRRPGSLHADEAGDATLQRLPEIHEILNS